MKKRVFKVFGEDSVFIISIKIIYSAYEANVKTYNKPYKYFCTKMTKNPAKNHICKTINEQF